jgi:multidrug transporter EmrE-like cation transporter
MSYKDLIIRVSIVLAWTILFSISQFSTKKFMTELPTLSASKETLLFAITNKWFYIAGIIFPISVAISCLSYRFMPVSTAGPLFFALGTIISLIVGVACFSEVISCLKGIGIGFCLLGISLIFIK